MKILVSDGLSEKGLGILKDSGLDMDVIKYSPEELVKEIGKYHAIIIRSGTKMTSEVIAAAENLKVIGRAGSGLDNVDIPAATKKGIVVMNTPGGNTITTAEHSISMLLSMVRRVPQAARLMSEGKWEKKQFVGVEIYNKVIGIIGVGQIGTHVAKIACGLFMNVIAYDPYLAPKKAKQLDIEPVSLDELYARADFISLHVPMTKDTAHMICKDSIAKMKDGVYIVNCARGSIVNENDLLEGLNSGKIAGAALDVFEVEPVSPDNQLIRHPNVISTPHLGAQTKEAQVNVAAAIAEQVIDLLQKGVNRNAINLPPVSGDALHQIRPYMELAEKLGSFLSQMYEGGLKKVTVEYHGQVAAMETASITIAAIKGLLDPILKENINFVNARSIAEERDIEICEVKFDDKGDFKDLIVLKIEFDNSRRSISGALFTRKEEPRVVSIDGFAVEIALEGNMLLIFNNDKPGVIGKIGTYLGENSVNISKMHFVRDMPGGRAIAVVNIDSAVRTGMLSEIAAFPNVTSVRLITL